MDTLKPLEEKTAEILVPRAFEWWTFLALAADLSSEIEHLDFVSRFSAESRVVIVDGGLLPETIHLLKDKALVIVILWDGYQSYREREDILTRVARLARRVELRIVGEPAATDIDSVFRCRPLFVQQPEIYNRETIFSAGIGKVSFSRPLAKTALRCRSNLISFKVLFQLFHEKKVHEYLRTKYVFCGHSGLTTLQRYSADYGVGSSCMPNGIADSFCELELVAQWTRALHRKKGHWANQIVIRALLRFIALRTLATHKGDDLFLNIFPDTNINAYQAGMLFKSHIFLDFGGSHGDETVYPRTADLLFLNRKVIRFDRRVSTTDLWNVRVNDRASIGGFLRRYQETVLSVLDGGRTCVSRNTQLVQPSGKS
jgi:hypothetical protein